MRSLYRQGFLVAVSRERDLLIRHGGCNGIRCSQGLHI